MREEYGDFARIVSECLKTSTEMVGSAQNFLSDIRHEEGREGISLFEVKNRDLLSYMNEVVYLMGQMSFAESIQDCSALERCVFLRTVLERIRPIELKLKPYVEKTMSFSTSTSNSKQVLRPRPHLMKVRDEEGDEESEENDGQTNNEPSTVKKYIAPKLVALRYDENENAAEERVMERARRRALQSSLISDLRAQYSEAPEEVQEEKGSRKMRQKDMERQRYEEDYMIRLQMSKKERHEHKLQRRQNVLNELLDFGDYMAMDESTRTKKGTSRKKRRTSVMGGPKSKRGRSGGSRSLTTKDVGKRGKKHSKKRS